MEAGNMLAGGGVSGAIMAALFIAYKCCYRRKFHSKCCGAEMDVDGGAPSPTRQEAPVAMELPRMVTPKPSPVIKPQADPAAPPEISV